MAEITLPPWEVAERDDFGYIIQSTGGKGLPAFVARAYTLPNAQLIAAVPDMLAALEWVLSDDWNGGLGSWATVQERLEAVIAKARGEG